MSDNSWYERGLNPPTGIICEKSFTSFDDEWSKVFIIGYTINGGIAYEIIDCPKKEFIGEIRSDIGQYKVSGSWVGEFYAFRPMKTERDIAIDLLVEEIFGYYENPKAAESYIGIANYLYDAGYRKTTPD